ncbi:MAG: histidine kinase [Cytophagaceae bacterium]|nr:histidine kinase [Cytophagaceae bacterium]
MLKILSVGVTLFFLTTVAFAQSEAESRAAWKRLQRQPLTKTTFRASCDLLQEIGKTNAALSYELLATYTAKVQVSGNRAWTHVLLMGWARAKSSMIFSAEPENLYRQARKNAGPGTRAYREAVVGTALMYGEWGKMDSLKKYLALGVADAHRAGDRENLSFLYALHTVVLADDTASLRRYLDLAIRLAAPLKDKNALFTARYNYANVYLQNNPQKQVAAFESLLELAVDSSLNRYPRRLYDRTAFTFRNAKASVYYQLMQINLLLTDYENAGKFAELFYDATVKPNPGGVQAAYFNAEMSTMKTYQGEYAAARDYLAKSRAVFNLPESQIPYQGYFQAAGLLAEHDGRPTEALRYFKKTQTEGSSSGAGLYLIPPAVHYVRVLTRAGRLADAGRVLETIRASAEARRYTAIGHYYYQTLAALQKAKGDYPAYARSLERFYEIKDSLTNLNQYRAVQQILAKVRIRDKEAQITRMQAEETARAAQIRRERRFYFALFGLAGGLILLLGLLLRNRQIRSRQREALHLSELERLEKQQYIERMQGAMEAEENERRKIADQLHDEVAALLALASLQVSSTLEKGLPDAQTEKKLAKAQEIITSVSATIRSLSHQLTPVVIEKYGFRRAIEELAEAINLSGKVHLVAVVVGFEDFRKYPVSFLNDLYRITQELVHNVLKHAQATEATVELVEHEGVVSLIVEDNGVGIDESPEAQGQGLSTIQSRVTYLNGTMEISRKKEGGTLVVLEMPVTHSQVIV